MIAPWLSGLLAHLAQAAAETAPAVAPAAEDIGNPLLIAIALLIVAVALAAIEFIVISGGMLGMGALGCAIAAVAYAFAAGPLAGWVFTALTPILGLLVLKAGVGWIRRSPLVTQAEITGDAGYHHAFADQDIGVGSQGELVTPAMPSGRARFAGRSGPIEIDVQIRGGTGATGDAVAITAISGPMVFCTRVPAAAAPAAAPAAPSAPPSAT